MYQGYLHQIYSSQVPSKVTRICIFVDLNKKSAKRTIKTLEQRDFIVDHSLLLTEAYSASNLQLINISFYSYNLPRKYLALYDDKLNICIPIEAWSFVRDTTPFVTIKNGIIQEPLTLSYGKNFLDSCMEYV